MALPWDRVTIQAIGLPEATARNIAAAAGLKGALALRFAQDNSDLITLRDVEELALLKHVVPEYETRVRRAISIEVFQHQFDALVSFAYNPGARFNDVTGLINRGEVAKALQIVKTVNTSGGVKMKGLVDRREREAALFLYADYGVLRSVG